MTTPPRLTHAEYVAFLDSLLVHPSCLFFASNDGKVDVVKEILRNNPNLDVNWRNEEKEGKTALFAACVSGHSAIVAILLARPNINVNLRDDYGVTPFLGAIRNEQTESICEVLKDSRVDVNEPDGEGYTPLWHVAGYFSVDTIKCWIAYGREMDLGIPGDEKTDIIAEAKKGGQMEVVDLLERFKSDAAKTRSEVRTELGITEFPVTTPPILTHAEYVAFLDSLPVHPSCPVFTLPLRMATWKR